MPSTEFYTIPARFRKLENLHIVLWLIKDLCWVMLWKPLGLFMIAPTIIAALVITWQTRDIKSELLHNIAVVCWICANAYWMITEFFYNDDSLRYYAMIPFLAGIVVIAYYYFGVLFLNDDAVSGIDKADYADVPATVENGKKPG